MVLHILPYLQQLEDPLYLQDNARPYAVRTSPNPSEEVHVNILPWLSRPPDFSSIEHMWDIMARKQKNLPNPANTGRSPYPKRISITY
ncbi:hypothetical protein Trydic_g16181 [Trypoxylus dichotomus]